MTILAIDTASNLCACGLYDPAAGKVLAERTEDIGRGHAEHLMGQIEAVLAEASLTLNDVTSIAVCVGPGSFTGIRVGVAAARGFALALGVEARGVTTLAAIAADVAREHAPDGPFVVFLKAGRDQVFWQSFDASGNATGTASMVPADQLEAHLPDDVAVIAGNASDLLSGLDLPLIATPATGAISTIARLSETGGLAPTPVYLRGADAKVQTGFAIARSGEGAGQ